MSSLETAFKHEAMSMLLSNFEVNSRRPEFHYNWYSFRKLNIRNRKSVSISLAAALPGYLSLFVNVLSLKAGFH